MKNDLTRTMGEAMRYIAEHDGTIERYPGGFWAREGWTGRNERWFGTTTIQALVSRGLLEYTRRHGTRQFPVEAKVAAANREGS